MTLALAVAVMDQRREKMGFVLHEELVDAFYALYAYVLELEERIPPPEDPSL